MRFQLRIEMDLEVEEVKEAEAAMSRAQRAAYDALGASAANSVGVLTNSQLTPVDEAAGVALAAQDLGPGITSQIRSVPLPPQDR